MTVHSRPARIQINNAAGHLHATATDVDALTVEVVHIQAARFNDRADIAVNRADAVRLWLWLGEWLGQDGG